MKAFDCRRCGECCYGEGGIYVEEEERKSIACFLNLTLENFLSGFCEVKYGRYYIITGQDGFCIFFNRERGCLIHPVKPGRCSQWPFYPAILKDRANLEMARDACPGINPECSFEEFVRQSKK